MNAQMIKQRAAQPMAGMLEKAETRDNLDDVTSGTWFDAQLCLAQNQAGLMDAVLAILKASSRRIRQRSQRQQQAFERLLNAVIANALRGHFYRAQPSIAYCRANGAYRTAPEWLSGRRLGALIDEMASAGLLVSKIGSWEGTGLSWFGHSSTYRCTDVLIEMLGHYGSADWLIEQCLPARDQLLTLRSGEEKNAILSFEKTKQTEGWVDALDAYNSFQSKFECSLEISRRQEASLVRSINSNRKHTDRQPKLTRPELFNRYLYRIFNDGTFDHGGRLYGGWWQQIPSWMRHHIYINGEETVEYDYSGMAIRMIYHTQGIDYLDDPYIIEPLTRLAVRLGRSPGHFRPSVKKLTQAILNQEDDTKSPELIKLDQSFTPHFTRAEVKAMIVNKHSEIADCFGTAIGKRCQRMDSDLALRVLLKLLGQGVLALPIHDSFIVQASHRGLLRNEMKRAYFEMFGFEPVMDKN